MQRLVIALALWLSAAVGWGQTITVPAHVPSGALIIATAQDAEAKGFAWFVTGPGGLPLFDPLYVHRDPAHQSTIVVGGLDGSYALMLVTVRPDFTVGQATVVVRRGGTVPPGPNPPVPPGPDPPVPPIPVPSGKLSILVIHESAESTPEFARLQTSLVAGEPAKYLKAQGHTLHVLDDDSQDPNGQPAKLVEQWRPQYAGLKLPAVLLIDAVSKTLVHKQEMPATGAAFIELLKKYGG